MPKVAGDATRLPFADDVFDAVTISFGLRNVVDTQAALREMARVTRPGGRLVVCEFSTPTNGQFATVYKEYLMRALPRVARAVSSNPEAYVYLAESIRAWPDQEGLAQQLTQAGWVGVRWRNLTGGIVALHAGTCPHAEAVLVIARRLDDVDVLRAVVIDRRAEELQRLSSVVPRGRLRWMNVADWWASWSTP